MNDRKKNGEELTDLEKADCLTGKMLGGIALKNPGYGVAHHFDIGSRCQTDTG
jgi:hypothetical protein